MSKESSHQSSEGTAEDRRTPGGSASEGLWLSERTRTLTGGEFPSDVMQDTGERPRSRNATTNSCRMGLLRSSNPATLSLRVKARNAVSYHTTVFAVTFFR